MRRAKNFDWWVTLPLCTAAFVFGCSGKSDSGGEDDNDDETGGSSGTGSSTGGSASGSAGTNSGTGGSSGASTGGSAGTAGAGSSDCNTYCQRLAMCPDGGDPACVQDCTDATNEATALGCLAPYRALLDCVFSGDVCAATQDQCLDEIDAYSICTINGGTGGGCAPAGSAPPSTDCASVCTRSQACPDADPTPCATQCADLNSDAAATGCTAEYQAFLGCANSCMDLCSVSDEECTTELTVYATCIIDYCSANPSSPACQ
jgi:hypothetical protein